MRLLRGGSCSLRLLISRMITEFAQHALRTDLLGEGIGCVVARDRR
jgi:hypothetical protein